MIWKAYKYFYYRIYSWNLKTWGKNDIPQLNAMLGMAFLSYMNLLLLAIIINIIFNLNSNLFPSKTPKITIAIMMMIWIGINIFIFLYKKKYKKIAQEFKNEKHKTRGVILLWLYIVLTFALPIIIGILSRGH